MKGFVFCTLFVCLFLVLTCNTSYGQRAGRQAREMASGEVLFHSMSGGLLFGRPMHQGVGYGSTRREARQNVCPSGTRQFHWVRTVRNPNGGFSAVKNTYGR